MHVRVHDPAYADRLAAFLSSVGQPAVVSAPHEVRLSTTDEREEARLEVALYLGVWSVLYPDAATELV